MAAYIKTVTWKELAEKCPEYYSTKKKDKRFSETKYQFICQCRSGHVFDYQNRIRYSKDNEHYAPCQGMCPICDESEFTFIGSGVNVYPITFNHVI